jgi:hypothetical protein
MTSQIRNVSIFLLATLLLVSSSLARRSAQPAGQSHTASTAPKSSQTSDSSATAQRSLNPESPVRRRECRQLPRPQARRSP